jgi:hypothetical protein
MRRSDGRAERRCNREGIADGKGGCTNDRAAAEASVATAATIETEVITPDIDVILRGHASHDAAKDLVTLYSQIASASAPRHCW